MLHIDLIMPYQKPVDELSFVFSSLTMMWCIKYSFDSLFTILDSKLSERVCVKIGN